MLNTRRSSGAILVGAAVLLATIAVPLPASAAPGDDVLVFSNGSVVDTGLGVDGGEYEWISAALTAGGYDVVPFDGGDGSALAWTTALTDIEVFVLPEQENGDFFDPLSPPAWLSEAGKDALVDWIQAGGSMLQSYACDPEEIPVLNDATGFSFDDALVCNSVTAPRLIDDATLPAQLDTPSATSSFSLASFSTAQQDAVTVWYAGAGDDCGVATDLMSAGVFAAGSGSVSFLGWDYFNDSGGDQASWNDVLASMIDGNAAASTWVPLLPPGPKDPVTASTEAGETLFTLSPANTCDVEHQVFRVDPTSALASPVGAAQVVGDARQGAWNPATGSGYFPFEDDDTGDDFLMTVDPTSGAFSTIGEFTIPDLDYINEVFALAIGPDGATYLMADIGIDGTDYELALFSLDLTDASLTFIAQVDDSQLDEPNGFAIDPSTGLAYAFEEDSQELFRIDLATGVLTLLGDLDTASVQSSSDVTAMQIGTDGTFWAVFDDATSSTAEDAGMLISFTLADISGGIVSATEVGIITDGPIPSWSLLLVPAAPELAATGPAAEGLLEGSLLLLLLGGALIGARVMRRRAQAA